MDDTERRRFHPRPLKHTMLVFVWAIGFWFGYEFGITDGVLSMPIFLEKYFPNVYRNMISNSDPFVLFGDFDVNLYRSCLYLIAFISAYTVSLYRIHTYEKLRIGIGLMLIALPMNCLPPQAGLTVITSARILTGMVMGIAIHVVVTHASEVASCRYRRRVMTLFPLAICSGILAANLWHYVSKAHLSKRLSLLEGSFSYLVILEALVVIAMVRAFAEIKWLMDGSSKFAKDYAMALGPAGYEDARSLIQPVENSPDYSIIFERKSYVPPLALAVCISVFQQLTGVYAFMICAPALFETVGLGQNTSLLCSSVMYGVNWAVACVSYATIDKLGRRSLFVHGGITMMLCQIAIAFILRVHENRLHDAMPKWNAVLLLVAMSGYVAGFASSWGPLGWLVPSEILPLKIQPIGYSLCVAVNMVFMFFITQFFATGLCKMRFVMHLIILSSVILMTIFVYVFLPETKGVEVENVSLPEAKGVEVKNVSELWTTHWFWKKFIEEDEVTVLSEIPLETP